MNKATSTLSQARNIAMALTMTFAATTLAACGNDESTDNTQDTEPAVSTEKQSSVSNDNAQTDAPEKDTEMEAESGQDNESAEAEEPESDSMASEEDKTATNDSSDTDATASDADEKNSEEAEMHTVKAVGLKYVPLVVTINPGDTVAWRNMPTHNTKSLEGLIPEGTEHWNSPMSQDYERTFTEEGIYVYKCVPHFGAGMGGAIIVGDPVNLDQIKNADAKGAAGRLVRKAIAEAEKM